jgi:imidazolonepropionase-like amidohydrolase
MQESNYFWRYLVLYSVPSPAIQCIKEAVNTLTRFILLCTLVASFAGAESLAITHVTLIDATGRPAQPDMTVIVAGDRIAAVDRSEKVKVPKDARVIDGKGKFLIPGLWDMHVHGAADSRAAQSYPLYLANGVLGVREMFGPPDAHAWRAQHASSDQPSPTVFLASPIVDGPKPAWRSSIAAANEGQGREAVVRQKERGADFIKVYDLLPRNVYFAIAAEAHERGIPFVGHVPFSVTVEEASDAGQKSIEHLTGVAPGCSAQEEALFAEAHSRLDRFNDQGEDGFDRHRLREQVDARAFETYNESKAQSLFARFVKNGTWQCPTLTVLRSVSSMDDPQFLNDARLKYVPKSTGSAWGLAFKDLKAEDWAVRRSLFRGEMELVGRMHRAGVNILAGTDTMNPYSFAGFSLHDELALLVEAGLPPMAAIQAATSNAARFMGQLDRRGTIEAGKIADLVLLEKDPLADIHNTHSVQAIVLSGKLLARAALDAMLAEAQALAEK